MCIRDRGALYILNNVKHEAICQRARRQQLTNAVVFLVLFLTFLVRTLLKDGYAYNPQTGLITMEPMKYLHNLLEMWPLLLVLLVGVGALLYGILHTTLRISYTRGIWPAGVGVVLTVLVLLLCTGWNHTAYYPSNADLQSSLTIANSCGSRFTLTAMSIVSLLIPFVLAYIFIAWRAIDRKPLTEDEILEGEAY